MGGSPAWFILSRTAWEGELDSPDSETSHPGVHRKELWRLRRVKISWEWSREGAARPRGHAADRPRGAPEDRPGPGTVLCLGPPARPSSRRLCAPVRLLEPSALQGTTPRPLRAGPLGAFSLETVPRQQRGIQRRPPIPVLSGRTKPTKPRFPSPRPENRGQKRKEGRREKECFLGRETLTL